MIGRTRKCQTALRVGAKKNETERTGFEPADPLRDHGFSKPALSTTQPPLPRWSYPQKPHSSTPKITIVPILDNLLCIARQIADRNRAIGSVLALVATGVTYLTKQAGNGCEFSSIRIGGEI